MINRNFKISLFLSFFLLFSFLILNAVPVFADSYERKDPFEIEKSKSLNYVPNEVLIKYKDVPYTRNFVAQKEKLLKNGLQVESEMKKKNILLAKFSENRDVKDVVNQLKKDPEIEIAQPNYLYELSTISYNDTYKNDLWGLDNTGQVVDGITGLADADIDAVEAWSSYSGLADGVIVAVLDSGVDYTHPDLLNKMWDGTNCLNEDGEYLGGCLHGYDFVNWDKDPMPTTASHGTQVSSIIAAEANNAAGVIGVSHNVDIMALKVDIGNSYGGDDTRNYISTNSLVSAISFAIYNNAKIINASFVAGGGDSANIYDLILYLMIDSFEGPFIAASGNYGYNVDDTNPLTYDVPIYPCSFNLPNIICVAATDSRDNLKNWSDYGLNSVDLAAPGDSMRLPEVISSPTTAFSENFEGVTPPNLPVNWTRSVGSNYWGTFGFTNPANKVLYGQLTVPYYPYANSYVTSPTINLSSLAGAKISFETQCDTEYTSNWEDYMEISFSSDGVNFDDWIDWDEASLDDDDDEFNHGQSTSGFFDMEIPLEYLTSQFKFRYSWITDDSGYGTIGGGCGIDDVLIEKYTKTNTYDFSSGTSYSAPYVSGVAALLLGHRPTATTEEIKQAIMYSGDSIASLSDKTVSGRRLNANSALAAIDIIDSFKFDIEGVEYPCIINQEFTNPNKTITCPIPGDIPKNNLAPTITTTGGTINPASGVAQNFLSNLTYTFTKPSTSSTFVEDFDINIVDYFRVFSGYRSGKWQWDVPSTKFLTSGDYDGDGKDEVAAMYDYNNSDMGILIFKPNGEAFTVSSWYRSGKWNWNVPSTRFLTSGDFNGDGKDEIGAMYDYGSSDMGVLIFKPNGEAFTVSSWYRSGKWNWNVPSTRFLTSGDFNGDDKDEIGAMYDYNNSDMGILTFKPNGEAFTVSSWYRSGKWNWDVPSTRFLTSGDFNGDGKDEIGAMYDYKSSDMGILTFKPNGEVFSVSSWYRSGKWNWDVPSTRFLTSGDFNGNGIDEIGAMYDYKSSDMGILKFR